MSGARFRLGVLELVPLAFGAAALVVATAFGWDATLLSAMVSPPPVVRLALALASLILALALLGGAVARMEERTAGSGGHLVTMLRGIRLAFLALAAGSVAIGWALGSPLPFVVALVIAGIDVIETSFLLIVVRREGR